MKKVIYFLIIPLCIIFLALQFFGTQIGMKFFEKPIYLMKPSPQRFAKDALYIMKEYGVFSDENNFSESDFLQRVKNAKNYDETIIILEEAIKVAGGKHSRIILATPDKIDSYVNKNLIVYPRAIEENHILTLFIPTANKLDRNEKEIDTYINKALEQTSDKENLKGVIIDLRGNSGGDMRPIIGAISPFLSDGELFYFSSNKTKTTVSLENGSLIMNQKEIQKIPPQEKINTPVAVLTDNFTASAAEVGLIALKGNKNLKIFGKPTAGLATGVTQIALYGDYYLALATTKIEDINGAMYSEETISPDEETDIPEEEAKKWLKNQDKN